MSVDPSGNQFITNPDGTITFVTGPNVNKTVLTNPDGDIYVQNPDGTRTYITGPNANKTVMVDPTGNEYTVNPDGSRNYTTPVNGQNFPSPSSDDVVNNLLDGNADIIESNGQTFIVYTDPTGRKFASPVDDTLAGGITFTDSTGVTYFVSSQPNSVPTPIMTDAQGNRYVMNPDGTTFLID